VTGPQHDVLCPNPGWCDDNGGFACQLIESGRVDGLQMALAAVDKGGRAYRQLLTLLHDDTPEGDR
jgi:hypothetical protein